MEQIYSFNNINLDIDYDDINEYILKVIQIRNKNIVKLSKNAVSFYFNEISSNENSYLYNYKKYNEIKQKEGINNFSILEFNDNYIIICSGKFPISQNKIDYITNDCYLSFIKIKRKNNDNYSSFQIECSTNKIHGLFIYFSVYEDNNILIRIKDDILGIGGKFIYLYSLKYKEIIQTVEIPSIKYNIYFETVSSFLMEKNDLVYVAIKYFTNKDELKKFHIKYYIYHINEDSLLNNESYLKFLSETTPYSQLNFFNAKEIQN